MQPGRRRPIDGRSREHHAAGHWKSNQTEHATPDLIPQLRRIRQPCNTETEHQTTGNPANHATLKPGSRASQEQSGQQQIG